MSRITISQTADRVGDKVAICGWVQTRRDHGKVIFIDLRDITGLIQVVFIPTNKETYERAQKLRSEWVIKIKGQINRRPQNMENNDLSTGTIEMLADDLEILSESKTPPFEIVDSKKSGEEIRLKYRYLDLRNEKLRNNLVLRHQTNQFIRNFLSKAGFYEVETPVLTKSTPEGARDYVVPSRLHAGQFYALPQSPQQYKQLLMVAGLEKYFQIARCFRDEDTRGDRQPEFTQLDLEMSFVEQEDILLLVEKLLTDLVEKLLPDKKISKKPFPRLTYQEAMKQYASDRPDLRVNKNDPNELAFGFVVDFPMFEWKEMENRWDAVHHPFTRPQTEDLDLIKNKPAGILAFQYDVVCNGYEVGGGSLRSYRPEVLETVFETMGHAKEAVRQKFGHLLEAFEYGVPPHGGLAIGLDRLLMILCGESTIREVIAFPKTGDGRDLLMDSPSAIEENQLKELHLKTF